MANGFPIRNMRRTPEPHRAKQVPPPEPPPPEAAPRPEPAGLPGGLRISELLHDRDSLLLLWLLWLLYQEQADQKLLLALLYILL